MRLVREEPYSSDPDIEAVIRELLAGDTPLLIDRERCRRQLNDAALIASSRKRVALACAARLEDALRSAARIMRRPACCEER